MRNADSAENAGSAVIAGSAENGERSPVKHAEGVTDLFEWRSRRYR
jgi:hypothetical protein